MRIVSPGHIVFVVTLCLLGIVGLLHGDFPAILQPAPPGLPARALLVYLCCIASLFAVFTLWPRLAAASSRLLLGCSLAWWLTVKVPTVLHAPALVVSWENSGETAVVVAGAGVLYAWFAARRDGARLGVANGERVALFAAGMLYGCSLIAFGAAHFAYVKLTASLVPGWLPFPAAWACLTGGTYIAAGLAILFAAWARIAARLAALQMGLFTLLVWVPLVMAGTRDASQWSETLISLTLTAAGWVFADAQRNRVVPQALQLKLGSGSPGR